LGIVIVVRKVLVKIDLGHSFVLLRDAGEHSRQPTVGVGKNGSLLGAGLGGMTIIMEAHETHQLHLEYGTRRR
jgi:hypothetical protein